MCWLTPPYARANVLETDIKIWGDAVYLRVEKGTRGRQAYRAEED